MLSAATIKGDSMSTLFVHKCKACGHIEPDDAIERRLDAVTIKEKKLREIYVYLRKVLDEE